MTFTDPEVAHVGLTEEQARVKFGENVKVCLWQMSRTDRAICEDDRDGFIKVIAKKTGSLLGATVVNARAGETITEFVVALKQNMNVSDLARSHPCLSDLLDRGSATRCRPGNRADAWRRLRQNHSWIIQDHPLGEL